MTVEKRVPLLHRTGLHLRAAGRFAETANSFKADVTLTVEGRSVNGKSVLEILTLGAAPGVELLIAAEGEQATEAAESLARLVRDNFGESGGE